MKYCIFLLLLCLASTANAGNLFPPNNIGSNPNIACPNGTVLKWTGDAVNCADPTPGVNVSCPTGKIMIGITKGVPTCITPTSSVVSAPSESCATNIPLFNGYPSIAACPTGYILTGGGYQITKWTPFDNTSSNSPDASSPTGSNSWYVIAGAKAGNSCFRAYAVCLRLQP